MKQSFGDTVTTIWQKSRNTIKLKNYLLLSAAFLIVSYFGFFFFDDRIIVALYREDGLFEYFSAIFLMMTSVSFMLIYYLKRYIAFLFLSGLFFLGFGEEISWGQRLLLFETPEKIKQVNIQEEFNFHNLKIFSQSLSLEKPGSKPDKFLDLNVLYKLFYLSWCLLLPLLYVYSHSAKTVILKFGLPVPPVAIGLFLVLNLTGYLIIKFYFMREDVVPLVLRALQEASEFYASSVLFVLSIYFLLNTARDRN